MRVVVLGAGFGGLEVTSAVSEALADDADVVLADRADGFVFGFSKLDVMFGRTDGPSVRHAYAQAGGSTGDASYDGLGICYLEFEDDTVAKVEVTF
jgi:NADH dehydrogenase FAD-containing subunit